MVEYREPWERTSELSSSNSLSFNDLKEVTYHSD